MKFALQDPVRVIAPRTRWFDQVGTVTDEAEGWFHVSGLDFPAPLWFRAEELVLAEWPNNERQEA